MISGSLSLSPSRTLPGNKENYYYKTIIIDRKGSIGYHANHHWRHTREIVIINLCYCQVNTEIIIIIIIINIIIIVVYINYCKCKGYTRCVSAISKNLDIKWERERELSS